MCGGGGGGGGDDSAAREAQRQAEQDAAIANINRIFGIESSAPSGPGAQMAGGGAGQDQSPVRPRVYQGDPRLLSAIDKKYGLDTLFSGAGRNRNNNRSQSPSEASRNRTAREALYDRTRGDVYDYYTNELDDQREDADRQARFSLARRGVAGGSSDIDLNADILKDYNRATLDIGNRADSAATRLKTNDEQARLDLINRVRAGLSGGDAIQSAYSQLETNAQSAKSNAVSDSLGQVFRSVAGTVNNQSVNNGRNRAYSDGNGTFVNANPGSYSGRNS